jgi:HAD superfamily hydrolase (TIGR01509 family)
MITTIITDFDGTLVDTFEANLRAYQSAIHSVGKELTAEKYKQCFGLRFDAFMSHMGIFDEKEANQIREAKAKCYPTYFDFLRPNEALISLIDAFHQMGGKTAIASTARKENLMNVVNYLNLASIFDKILAGIDVKKGKPSPEIYIKAMEALNSSPSETLIFEDSEVGIEAAKASGAKYLKITL